MTDQNHRTDAVTPATTAALAAVDVIRWGGIAALAILEQIAVRTTSNPHIQQRVDATYVTIRNMERRIVIKRAGNSSDAPV